MHAQSHGSHLAAAVLQQDRCLFVNTCRRRFPLAEYLFRFFFHKAADNGEGIYTYIQQGTAGKAAVKNIDSAIVYFTCFLFGLHTAYFLKKSILRKKKKEGLFFHASMVWTKNAKDAKKKSFKASGKYMKRME
jgi:hypothetical protein